MLRTVFPIDGPHTADHSALHRAYNAALKSAVKFVLPDDGEAKLRTALYAGGTVRLAGLYNVTEPLVVANNTHIECAPLTTIKAAAAAMDFVVGLTSPAYAIQHFSISNLIIDANNLATNGLFINRVSLSNFTAINGLRVTGAVADGIYLQNCQCAIFQALAADHCGGNGVMLEGCNGARFYGLSATRNTGNGVMVQEYGLATGGLGGIFGLHSESNGGHGIHIKSRPTQLWGGWLEGNAGDGVRIESDCVLVQGLGILGGGADHWAIHIMPGSNGIMATGNFFEAGADSYARIAVEPGAGQSLTLSPNFYRYEGPEIQPVYL